MLIALRAPRPLFVTSGVKEKGDAWVDPTGMWLAVMAAEPAWGLYGEAVPEGTMPKPGSDTQAGYRLGWYQHTEGHVPVARLRGVLRARSPLRRPRDQLALTAAPKKVGPKGPHLKAALRFERTERAVAKRTPSQEGSHTSPPQAFF